MRRFALVLALPAVALAGACSAPPPASLARAESVEHHILGDHEVFYLRDASGLVTLEAGGPFDYFEIHLALSDAEFRALDAAGAPVIEWTDASTLTEDSDPVAWEGAVALDRPATTVELRIADEVRFGRIATGHGELWLHEADVSDDDEAGVIPTVAHPGRWIPPPDVLAEANQQYLPYSGAPSSCAGTFKPGTRELADFLKASFAGAASYGGYACRVNTANTSQLSVHASGRAIDLFVPLHGGAADNDLGDPIAHYLISHAVGLGIEYLIWDRTSWGAYRSAPKHRYYSGPHPHHDHLHIEVSPSKANQTGKTFPPINDCACAPGETRTKSCGNCGHRVRTCGANCQWGNWGTCKGQGPCAARASETRDCGDCGTQTRRCTQQCQWGSYDACEGPDPDGGNRSCDTGEPGACVEGRQRCRQGNLTCERLRSPSDELCDGTDNDCDGRVDDGGPTSLGETPPRFAADLVDLSWPRGMKAGEVETVWVDFRNVGTQEWPAGEVWLQARSTLADEVSPLHDVDSWVAWNVPAVAWDAVPPGEDVRLSFGVKVGRAESFEDSFHLRAPDGALIGCPRPSFTVAVEHVDDGWEFAVPPAPAPYPIELDFGPPTSAPATEPERVEATGRACGHVDGKPNVWWVWLFVGAIVGWRRRRRSRRGFTFVVSEDGRGESSPRDRSRRAEL